MIEFRGVSYAHENGNYVLKNIDLNISKGERVGIVGPNGSGKTTLALLVNGILRATRGRVRVDGLDPADEKEGKLLKRKVGLVFQNPDNQLVSTTVEREVAFSLENLNLSYRLMKDRVDAVIDFFGLEGLRYRLTSELSGGEKQKLALASIMVMEPDVLILDEPGSYLDESGRRLLEEALSHLLKSKPDLTLIRITQYSNVAEMCERLLVFGEGQIRGDGRPEEIFSNPANFDGIGIEVPWRYRIAHQSLAEAAKTPDIKAGWGQGRAMAINAEEVCFRYHSYARENVFDKLHLRLSNDRVYGLVGPSGSGKTTLIQLMAGLLKPSRGKILYEGLDSSAGKVVVSFQQSERQFFLETVEKEIRFGAENIGLNDIEAITAECYRLVGLDSKRFASRNPFSLSGGEKRRLAFASILSLRPEFIFFDEPTCALDAEGIAFFRRLVSALRRGGIGVVIISHYGNIIMDLADEIIALRGGRISAQCGKKEFFREVDYSGYLSMPELIRYQLDNFGEVRFFSEEELRGSL